MRGNNNNNNNNLSNNSNNNNNNMEQSFYEDSAQFTPVTAANNAIKRPHTLDLNSKPLAKKQRITQTPIGTAPLVLNSPDLQLLKFNTPELEKFIMANNSLQTPTPSLVFPTKVTSEQEDYAKGFVDALNSLHNSENSQVQIVSVSGAPSASVVTTSAVVVNTSNNISTVAGANIGSSSMSGGSITYTNLDESFPVAIKDEPQTVPNSPPLSPIDMETQERIKLERKRQRNRVAASKCRKRKLERISKLEDKVKMLKGENTDLASVIKQLKEHVFTLKQQVIDHINAGCNVTLFNNAVLQTK